MDWSMIIGPAFGLVSHHVFRGAKSVFGVLDKAPAVVQQTGVLALSAGVVYAGQYVPFLAEVVSLADPNAAAGISAATAYGVHRPKG